MVFVEVSSRGTTMRNSKFVLMILGCAVIGIQSCSISVEDAEPSAPLARQSVAEQPGNGVPEVSTEDMERILENQSAVVLDTRPHLEWSLSHIPGAVNVAPKPGVSIALYTSDEKEVERIVGGDKSQALVLYCNGPFCGKSKRVAMYSITIRLLSGLTSVTPQNLVKGASPARETCREVWFFQKRIPARSLQQRMTGGFQCRTTTPASSSSARPANRRATLPRRWHVKRFTT